MLPRPIFAAPLIKIVNFRDRLPIHIIDRVGNLTQRRQVSGRVPLLKLPKLPPLGLIFG